MIPMDRNFFTGRGIWTRINAKGMGPTPRFGHTATKVRKP
jgi:hypothetical protein